MKSRDEARRDVRLAVQAHMASRQWNKAELQDAAGIDANTAGDFLNGARWPQAKTLAKIEGALGWKHGTIAAILEGAPAPSAEPAGELGPVDDTDADFDRIEAMHISEDQKAVLRATLTALLWPAGRPPADPGRVRRVAGS